MTGGTPILGKFQMGLSNRESDTGTQYTWPFFVKDDEIHYETYIHQDLQIESNRYKPTFMEFWGFQVLGKLKNAADPRHSGSSALVHALAGEHPMDAHLKVC